MKNLLFSLALLLTIGSTAIFGANVHANTHTFSICNINRISANQVQFEVWMKNTDPTSTDTIHIFSPTLNIDFNNAIANGGALSLTMEDITAGTYGTKFLPADIQPPNPIIDTIGGTLLIRANGMGDKTPYTIKTGLKGVIHYTLLRGDSVICALYTLATDAASFAVQPLNLAFRPYSGSAPVTSCTYFKTYDEGGSSYFYKSGVAPVGSTLSTATNESYNNIDANGNTALPVELTSFSASSITGRDVNLTWKTATEVNFARFVVERTVKSASSWSVAGTVSASGNSNSEKTYTFSDKKLNTGSYEYRLKMVDNDGAFSYSTANVEATVAKPKSFEMSQNYPNPFNPTTKIDYQLAEDAHVVVEIYNITGQKVAQILNEQQAAGYYTMPINSSITSSLASGIYLYRIAAVGAFSDAKFVSIKKMILMK